MNSVYVRYREERRSKEWELEFLIRADLLGSLRVSGLGLSRSLMAQVFLTDMVVNFLALGGLLDGCCWVE